MSEDVRIVLIGEANSDHDKMLTELRSDQKVSINSSRLINWIVHDYFQNFFEKRKGRISKAHFNSRKCILAAMKNSDPEEVSRALKELARNIAPAKGKSKCDPK